MHGQTTRRGTVGIRHLPISGPLNLWRCETRHSNSQWRIQYFSSTTLQKWNGMDTNNLMYHGQSRDYLRSWYVFSHELLIMSLPFVVIGLCIGNLHQCLRKVHVIVTYPKMPCMRMITWEQWKCHFMPAFFKLITVFGIQHWDVTERYLPTTYVVRGKVMLSEVSVRLFIGGGGVRPVLVLPSGEGTSCFDYVQGRGMAYPVLVLPGWGKGVSWPDLAAEGGHGDGYPDQVTLPLPQLRLVLGGGGRGTWPGDSPSPG